ncbi:MAG: ABC-2 type transport system permease protein, partial [Saprospiraceae bacterium]
TRPLITFTLFSLIVFVGSGCFIFYNTNIKNEYTNSDQNEKLQADYEKTLKKFENIAQPKITDVYLEVDIFPKNRDFEARGVFQLKNKTSETISEIHLQYYSDNQVTNTVKFSDVATIKEAFEEFKYYIYQLKNPLAPGDSLQMDFVTKFNTEGFVESGSNTEVLNNGTFFNNTYFPTLGYSDNMELGDDDKRKEQDLLEKERQLERNDPVGLAQNLLTDDSDRLNLEVIMSTTPDQIAIAPGYLQKEWEENGRKYFHYKMDEPILGFFSFVSAKYEILKDVWMNKKGEPVNLEIYYHKGHDLNIDRMMMGMKKSLDYFSKNFSPYQYRQLRIMEFPRYRSFAQSFPNTVPFSEDMGFIMDIGEDDIDFPFYVTAHEVGHQWWAHQVTEANVKGNAMLSETMAQYSALMVMKNTYPTEMMQKFLKFEMNSYLRGRSREQKKEQPLEFVERQGYIHYRKGAVVMYALQDYISEDSVNLALQRCIKDWAYREDQYITSADLLEYFREVTPDSLQYIIKDMFETITLFENRTTEATYEKVGDAYQVNLDISSIKYRADSLGNESPIEVNDWIDIGVYAEDENGKDKILYLKKHKINQKEMHFEILVDEKPTKAGIDPINKMIDRNPDDNRKKLTLKEDG